MAYFPALTRANILEYLYFSVVIAGAQSSKLGQTTLLRSTSRRGSFLVKRLLLNSIPFATWQLIATRTRTSPGTILKVRQNGRGSLKWLKWGRGGGGRENVVYRKAPGSLLNKERHRATGVFHSWLSNVPKLILLDLDQTRKSPVSCCLIEQDKLNQTRGQER